jgi:outer membrane protein assembly factor BamB
MFEALEALQGQDLSVRFLPISIRYSKDDQTLDEKFILNSLSDIREKVSHIEADLIEKKHFFLAGKLEKLAFIQNNLPKVLMRMEERVYPIFDLWSESSSKLTMLKLLEYCGAPLSPNLDSVAFNVSSPSYTGENKSRLSEVPFVIWKSYVGIQSKNNQPVPMGNEIIVSSCGREWNSPDEEDGIICLHADTGLKKWHYRTYSDANKILISKGVVVAGCDNGDVFGLQLIDGREKWKIQLNSGVVGGAIKLPAKDSPIEPILISTYDGRLVTVDILSGDVLQTIEMKSNVLGEFGILPGNSKRFGAFSKDIAVPLLMGSIALISYNELNRSLKLERILECQSLFEDNDCFEELASSPVAEDRVLIQPFVRHTYHNNPPLIAFDNQTLDFKWKASAPKHLSGSFGNIRGKPLIFGSVVVFATAYSNSLHAVSLEDGSYSWSIELGQIMFEQWSAPVMRKEAIYLGCHDGYIHKVNTVTRKREWSMYLGDFQVAGSVVAQEQRPPEFDDSSSWVAGKSSPILATPTIDRGRLYVSTKDGWLYCIGNI